MYDTIGMMLREAWQQSGKTHCHHPKRSEERSCSGISTGAYICTTCGNRLVIQHPATSGASVD
jgi:hypothetical protein